MHYVKIPLFSSMPIFSTTIITTLLTKSQICLPTQTHELWKMSHTSRNHFYACVLGFCLLLRSLLGFVWIQIQFCNNPNFSSNKGYIPAFQKNAVFFEAKTNALFVLFLPKKHNNYYRSPLTSKIIRGNSDTQEDMEHVREITKAPLNIVAY